MGIDGAAASSSSPAVLSRFRREAGTDRTASPFLRNRIREDQSANGHRVTRHANSALDPADTFTIDQAVADAVEVTNYLRERFGHDRIYLVGNSWGFNAR